jgi:hypothetical protein
MKMSGFRQNKNVHPFEYHGGNPESLYLNSLLRVREARIFIMEAINHARHARSS